MITVDLFITNLELCEYEHCEQKFIEKLRNWTKYV